MTMTAYVDLQIDKNNWPWCFGCCSRLDFFYMRVLYLSSTKQGTQWGRGWRNLSSYSHRPFRIDLNDLQVRVYRR
jgi:hypothetical protein